jgi:thiol-disulfide isomerase/thioredoxin
MSFCLKKTKNMKKILFSALAMLMLMACNQAPNGYKITGTLDTDEFDGKWVYVAETLRKLATEPIDSAQIIDGKFQMQGVATEPLMSVVVIADENRQMVEQGVGAYFILENGNIKMHVDTAYVMTATGTDFNRVYAEYDSLIMSYDGVCAAIGESEASNAEKFEAIVEARKNYKESLKNLVLPYIETQPAKKFVKDIKHLYTNEELAILMPTDTALMARSVEQPYMAVGSYLSDEATPNAAGDTIRWMDIVSQHDYTLIDFWASWCGPCMRSMPGLKELYAEHAGQHFEIIGISLDNNRDKWLGAIERLDLKWVQLSNLLFWDEPMVKRFEIPYIPSTMLVDREGKIIIRNPNHDELAIYLNK